QSRCAVMGVHVGPKNARDPKLIEHTVEELVGQRIYGMALGYEDLNDHDLLRRDPLLAAAVGKIDPEGQERRREADRGAALAGKSTPEPYGVAFRQSGREWPLQKDRSGWEEGG